MTDPVTQSRILADVFVPGRPRTKGSLKTYCMQNRTHTIRHEEQVAESKPWRAKMARALREVQLATSGRLLQHTGAVEVRLTFWFPREDSVSGGVWESHDTPWPTAISLGDADKLTRNALDAMLTPTKRDGMELCSALLADDSQVVGLTVWKFWEDDSNPAGVRILAMEAPFGATTCEIDHE